MQARSTTGSEDWWSVGTTGLASRVERGQASNSAVPGVIVRSSCRSDKISSMFSSFDTQKSQILRSIGFDGLLKIPLVENMNNELSLWLYQRVDFKNKCLNLDGGAKLYFTNADVNLVLGIPFFGRCVHWEHNQPREIITAFKQKLFKHSTSSPLNISMLEDILTKQYANGLDDAEIEAFKIASILFAVGYFLAPEMSHEFPLHLIQNFLPVVNPSDINWADLVLSTLNRACYHTVIQMTHARNNITLFGCSLFLQVFYLDNMNFGPSTPFHSVLPRASAYTHAFTSKLVEMDFIGISNDHLMQFGNAQVRQGHEVCYSRGWQEHLNMVNALQHASEDDYLKCIEILSRALQLFDNFAAQINEANITTLNPAEQLLQSTKTTYLNFTSKLEDDIHNLSSKAADLVKKQNLKLYHHYNQQHVQCSANVLVDRSHMNISRVFHEEQGSSSSSKFPYSSKKSVRSHSKFPSKFNDQMYDHPEVSWQNKYACYLWMTNKSLPFAELNRNWVIFSAPISLSITGHEVRHCLKLNGIFTVSIVDAIMSLWTYLDAKMYNYYWELEQPHKIWRHFLPASFAEFIKRDGDYLNSDIVRSIFIGEHITYDVEHCQQITMPVYNGETWSCYIWDFKFKTITVLDPILMTSSARKAKEKHQDTVFKLHNALFACKDQFFCGWDVQHYGWNDVYVTDLGHKCSPQNSGIYAIHYARSFCGPNKLAFRLKEPYETNLCVARGEILYHFVTCAENKGYKAELLMEKISYHQI